MGTTDLATFSYRDKDYEESDAVKQKRTALDTVLKNKPTDWNTQKNYAPVQNALSAYKNRNKFSYDINGDMLYQQYKDQYVTQGKQAMMDAIGQASALTGGYGNSYAQTVGQQTYQGYLQGLNNKIPELYQLALDTYNQQGQDLLNAYSLEKDKYDTDYSEWQDAVNKYNSDREYAYNDYNQERSYDYAQYSDAYNRAFELFQQDVSDDRAALVNEMDQMFTDDDLEYDETTGKLSLKGTELPFAGSGSLAVNKLIDTTNHDLLRERFTLENKGGKNFGGPESINNNAKVSYINEYGNKETIRMDALYKRLVSYGMDKETAKNKVIELQKALGCND